MLCNVQQIIPMRSMKRHRDTGEMMVHVIWENGETTFEPLSHFYNGVYYNIYMSNIIMHYKTIATHYPYHKRNCLLCNKRVEESMIFCKSDKCAFIRDRYE